MVHAYEEAKKRGWRTVGYACGLAADFEKFPVDEEHIIGNQWGAESVSFVDHATHSGNMFYMVNIAGGNQAARETEAVRFAGGTIYRVELTRE